MAVGRERQHPDLAPMAPEGPTFSSGRGVPEDDVPVPPTRRQGPAVGCQGEGGDPTRRAPEGEPLAAVGHVPEPGDGAGAARRDHAPAVGRERHQIDGTPALADREPLATARRVPEPDIFIRTRRGQGPAVGGERDAIRAARMRRMASCGRPAARSQISTSPSSVVMASDSPSGANATALIWCDGESSAVRTLPEATSRSLTLGPQGAWCRRARRTRNRSGPCRRGPRPAPGPPPGPRTTASRWCWPRPRPYRSG